jgi:hypothetical protein
VTKPARTCSTTSRGSTTPFEDTRRSATSAWLNTKGRWDELNCASTKPAAGHFQKSTCHAGCVERTRTSAQPVYRVAAHYDPEGAARRSYSSWSSTGRSADSAQPWKLGKGFPNLSNGTQEVPQGGQESSVVAIRWLLRWSRPNYRRSDFQERKSFSMG